MEQNCYIVYFGNNIGIIKKIKTTCLVFTIFTIEITVEAEGIESIEVLDLQGQLIEKHCRESGNPGVQSNTVSYHWMPDQAGHDINLSQESKGIYIIKVTTNSGVAVEKVVLE